MARRKSTSSSFALAPIPALGAAMGSARMTNTSGVVVVHVTPGIAL
jgi:hypothetical protein